MGFVDKLKARKEQRAAAAALEAHRREVADAAAQASVVHEQLEYMRLSEPTHDVNGVMLKASEVAYLVVEGAAFVEPKRAPGQWKGRSQGTSFRVAKGVSYRIGGSKGTFQEGEERPTPTDTGTFVITDQRCIFVGSKRTTEWAYSKLVGYDTDGPGTAFFNVSNRQKTTGVMFGEANENRVDAVIAAAIARFSGPGNHERLIAAVEAEYRYLYSVWQALSEGQPAPMRPPTPEGDRNEESFTGDAHDAESATASPLRSNELSSADDLSNILRAAGFAESQGHEGFGIKHDGDRFKVYWLNSDTGMREERVPAMAKALRDSGHSARVARHGNYPGAPPYVSVTE